MKGIVVEYEAGRLRLIFGEDFEKVINKGKGMSLSGLYSEVEVEEDEIKIKGKHDDDFAIFSGDVLRLYL